MALPDPGNVFVRTGLASGGNIIITGNVTIPGEIDTHITAIGSLGNITTPYMPIGGNVIVTNGNITAVVSGTVAVSSIAANVTVVDGGGSITVDGNVNATITGGNVATTITGTNLDAFGRLRVSNPVTLFDSQNRYIDGDQFSNITATGGNVVYVANESSFNLNVSAASGSSVNQTKQNGARLSTWQESVDHEHLCHGHTQGQLSPTCGLLHSRQWHLL
jgi:hypothetical protein